MMTININPVGAITTSKSIGCALNPPVQAKVRLPRSLTNVVKTDEDKVLQLHITGTRTHPEAKGVGVIDVFNLVLILLKKNENSMFDRAMKLPR